MVQVLNRFHTLDAQFKAPSKPVRGLTPPALNSSVHVVRCHAQLRSKDKPIEKYIYLSQLKHADEHMFYHLCLQNISEIAPLVCVPTVGDACLQFSEIYRRPEGIFISYEDKGSICSILESWPFKEHARIAVVTDGSRILGLGDLGANGMPVPIGKLALYVAGAGIRPSSTIPICLDLGTNNEKYLNDPLYLGLRRRRVSDAEMGEFMEEFMEEMCAVMPQCLVQFEDFSTENAFKYLEVFRHCYDAFNDDIQGTGAVALSGFLNAAKLSSAAAGKPLEDQRILFLGAGSAGVGVAMQLMSFFTLLGTNKEDARRRIWLVDSQGLVYSGRGRLAEHKKYFSRDDYSGPPLTNLVDIINFVKPTTLFGLSSTGGAFNKEVIETMTKLNARPIIFALSNPVNASECHFHEAVEFSDGEVIFGAGCPFMPLNYKGKEYYPGQSNNMYTFPGLGLGSILSQTKHVTDGMVEASALALADSLTEEERTLEMVYPRVERIREISAHIAACVIRAAQKDGTDRNEELRSLNDEELLEYVKEKMWHPRI